MGTGGWIFVVVVVAGSAATAGYFIGRDRLRKQVLAGGGTIAGKGHSLNAPVVNPKIAATALALTAAQGKPQKV